MTFNKTLVKATSPYGVVGKINSRFRVAYPWLRVNSVMRLPLSPCDSVISSPAMVPSEETIIASPQSAALKMNENNEKASPNSSDGTIPNVKTFILVDYENVGLDAFIDVEKIDPEKERVCLFSTEKAPRIPTATVAKILEVHRQNVDVFTIHEVPVKNQSVDMHLVSYLGYLIGVYGTSCNYVIRSSDTDYDNIVKYWRTREKVNVKRIGKTVVKPQTTPNPSAAENIEISPSPLPSTPAVPTTPPKNIDWNIVMQRAISEAGFSPKVGGQVASIVCKGRNDTNFPTTVFEKIKSAFPNNEKLLTAVKTTISNNLGNLETSNSTPSSPQPSYKATRTPKKTKSLKNTVVTILSDAKVTPEASAEIAEIAAEHYDKDNAKQALHGALVQKYAQPNGSKIYNLLKDLF